MDKLFNPESIVILGPSSKPNNIPRLILENLLRWGYRGRIFGINPNSEDVHVDGIKMYTGIELLPIVPDLAVTLIPARFIPETIDKCGRFGIRRMAIPSGGFNELGEEGVKLAEETLQTARKYGIRFIGPNALTLANTANGLCLPFPPLYSPPKGGLSLITQSGGVGLMLWNLLTDENVGMAKFASIGNKLDLTEIDFLEYFGQDPETKIIGMYLESITEGEKLVETASRIDKPIVIYKSNTTNAGKRAAMSHTAAISSDEEVTNAAFDRAGIIRIKNFTDFVSISKCFELPPMQGNRIMAMSPAGGFAVMMADLCEKIGFEFADPGESFYKNLGQFTNAGVIKFSNPLDMGDIYDPKMSMDTFYSVLHNENVDAAVYVSQWPHMPKGEDVFFKMFQTDLSKETFGAVLSSGKPMGICLFGLSSTISRIKQNVNVPLFNSPEEMLFSLKQQQKFYARKGSGRFMPDTPEDLASHSLGQWLQSHKGTVGEETLDLLNLAQIPVARSVVTDDPDQAVATADEFGYPVVMKIVSPDAIHKSEAGGVLVGINDASGVQTGFHQLKTNLLNYKKDAKFDGIRVMEMAGDGVDMFIGGRLDEAFGPIVSFGYGGIYVEVFKDVAHVLCPSNRSEILSKIKRLKSYAILKGQRGNAESDIDGFVDTILKLSHLLATYREINELDLNPVRIFPKGQGVMALDARLRIDNT